MSANDYVTTLTPVSAIPELPCNSPHDISTFAPAPKEAEPDIEFEIRRS
jgi:hypothetical protein